MQFELREMDFGTILDRGLKLFKDNFAPLAIIFAIFFGPFVFASNYSQSLLLNAIQESGVIEDIMNSLSEGGDFVNVIEKVAEALENENVMTTMSIVQVLTFILYFIMPLAFLGVYKVFANHLLEVDATWWDAIRFATTRYWILFAAGILSMLVLMAAFCCASVGLMMLGPCGIAIWFILYILAIIFAGAFFSILICVVSMESVGAIEAMTRAWYLLRGFWWRTVGIFFVVSLIIGIVVIIFSAIGGAVATLFPDPIQIPLNAVISTLFSVLSQPIIWAVTFLVYLDIRIRKEHFDLDILAQRTISTEPLSPTGPPDDSSDDAWR